MEPAATVTFSGSDLDRAAHLRRDASGLAELAGRPAARSILLWRGKPLIDSARRLVMLPMDHPLLGGAQIFLGLVDGQPLFVSALTGWAPTEEPATVGAMFDPSEQRHPDLPDKAFAELRNLMTQLTPREAEIAATARALFVWHESHRFCARCGHASDMTMGGWQRSCPSCDTQHFPRTDPVVIMLVTHGNDVLIGRSPGWPEGMYSLLAGFIEPGETVEAAVAREVFEETGVHVGQVSFIASQPWPFPASLMIGCRCAATSRDITLDPAELEHALWMSREDMAQVFAGTHPQVRPSRPGAIAHFILSNWLADRLD